MEAENADHNTGLDSNPLSSGGQHLHSFDANWKYVDFTTIFNNSAEVTSLTMSYVAPSDGKIGLYINGVRHDFNFVASNVFTEVTKAVSIPVGSTVKLQYDTGDVWINLDYIEYIQ